MAGEFSVVHICFGATKEHLKELERGARGDIRPSDWWTINSKAVRGNRAVFYMMSPRSQFVATGIVAEKPYLQDSGEFAGKYCAHIVSIKMLPRPIHLRDVNAAFPDWGYLRAPHRSAPVPSKFAPAFMALLEGKNNEISFAEEADVEGIKIEIAYFAKTRSRRLRDAALTQSRGVCCVCGTDFSKILGGRGVRVLQVHHRNQLAKLEGATNTTITDLAVVCANCHLCFISIRRR